MKIHINDLAKFIEEKQDEIQSMDSKTIPAVLIELRHTQLKIDNSDASYLSVEFISKEAIESVFPCWMMEEEGLDWLDKMTLTGLMF
jgi:hypothetical protein